MTQFLQVSDNSKTRAIANSLNNTTNPITLSGIDTTKFESVSTGYVLTIWDDTTYSDPGDDPNMEKCLVTAAVIAFNGSFTISRPFAKLHAGTPRVALLVVSQHIKDITDAITRIETTLPTIGDKYFVQEFDPTSSLLVTHNLNKYPAVTIINSANDAIEGDITYINNNSLLISFTAALGGKVTCN